MICHILSRPRAVLAVTPKALCCKASRPCHNCHNLFYIKEFTEIKKAVHGARAHHRNFQNVFFSCDNVTTAGNRCSTMISGCHNQISLGCDGCASCATRHGGNAAIWKKASPYGLRTELTKVRPGIDGVRFAHPTTAATRSRASLRSLHSLAPPDDGRRGPWKNHIYVGAHGLAVIA